MTGTEAAREESSQVNDGAEMVLGWIQLKAMVPDENTQHWNDKTAPAYLHRKTLSRIFQHLNPNFQHGKHAPFLTGPSLLPMILNLKISVVRITKRDFFKILVIRTFW